MIKEKILIFGENHYDEDYRIVINKRIERLKPDYLLHELLYEVEAVTRDEISKYLGDCSDKHNGPLMCEPSINKDIYELGYKYNIPLIGIDIDNYDNKLKNLSLKEIFRLREERMVEKIYQFYNKGRIVVVVGDTHLRTLKTRELGDISLIQKRFSNDRNVKIIRSFRREIE